MNYIRWISRDSGIIHRYCVFCYFHLIKSFIKNSLNSIFINNRNPKITHFKVLICVFFIRERPITRYIENLQSHLTLEILFFVYNLLVQFLTMANRLLELLFLRKTRHVESVVLLTKVHN